MSARIILAVYFIFIFKLTLSSYIDIDVSEDNVCWFNSETSDPVKYCRRDASFKWDVWFDYSSTDEQNNGLKDYCCAHHEYFNCMKRVVRHSNCTETDKLEIFNATDIQESLLAKLCDSNYKNGSWACEFPLWATLLAFVGFLSLFGLLAYVLFGVLGIQNNA